MKLDKQLNDIFNIEQEDTSLLPVAIPNQNQSINMESDFDLARDTLKNLILKNNNVIDEIINIASQSEHPRAFEVAGQLIKAQSDIAKDLMNLHKQKKEVSGEDTPSIHTQNNIVFTGPTSDLMKMISAQRVKTIDSK